MERKLDGKTVTFANGPHEVYVSTQDKLFVFQGGRAIFLDDLTALGLMWQYDVVAREKLPYGLYSYGGNLEHAEIYRYNRSGWWNGNLPAGEDDFIAIEAALAENLLYKLRIDENEPLC